MKLEDAVKKAYENKPSEIVDCTIDGTIVNLNCKKDDGSIFPARIFMGSRPYHWDSPYDVDYIEDFKEEIIKYL